MDPETKNLWDVVFNIANLIVLIVGLVWAARRFKIERTHEPHMEFDVECRFLGPQAGYFACEILVRAKNRGLIRHEFRTLNLRIRGISKGVDLTEWPGHEPRLCFPNELLKANMLYAPKFDYIFVEPGVEQVLTYAARIADENRFVAVRAEFIYSNGNSHSAERIFEVKPAS